MHESAEIQSALELDALGHTDEATPRLQALVAAHPQDLTELLAIAKCLRNPHAEATTGVDLQVPAIMTYLQRHGLANAFFFR